VPGKHRCPGALPALGVPRTAAAPRLVSAPCRHYSGACDCAYAIRSSLAEPGLEVLITDQHHLRRAMARSWRAVPCLDRGPSETLTGVPCARGPDASDLSWQVLQPVRPAMPDRLGDRLAVAVVSSISSPCTNWPQDCRVSRWGKHPATSPSRSASSADRASSATVQQRLPRLGCVSQTHHDRGSRTYAVIRLTCASNPTVTNYCCRT